MYNEHGQQEYICTMNTDNKNIYCNEQGQHEYICAMNTDNKNIYMYNEQRQQEYIYVQ